MSAWIWSVTRRAHQLDLRFTNYDLRFKEHLEIAFAMASAPRKSKIVNPKLKCGFCKREVPTRGHHVVPRCKGGTEIVLTCHSCEDFIHKTWSHNELQDTFNTVETILADVRFQKSSSGCISSRTPLFF